MKALYSKILKKITPTEEELILEKKLVDEIREKIEKIEGKHSHIEWCGSSARGTHLRGDKDIDLFVMFEKDLPAEELEKEGLRVAKKIFEGHKWELAYSQHPYIRGEIKGFEVEIVPSYIVTSGEEKQSAVDRTPFHNRYLLEKMNKELKTEARLLKQFLKGINSYGADLKNCALPGYGAELIVLKYGGFENAIKGISKWKLNEAITFENSETKTAHALFPHSPLIIIDPVDATRNVASALSLEQFERMVLAAQIFSKKPLEKFFFPKERKAWGKGKVKKMLEKKELIAIHAPFPKAELSDIVWGQLRRILRKTGTHLKENDFEVLRENLWSDEKEVIMIFELAALTLQKAKKITGPPASDNENSKRFLEKKRKLISGPRVENGRIVIEIERKETSAKKILQEFVKNEKKSEKGHLKKMFSSAHVHPEKEILATYKGDFAKWLSNYLEGKEIFE